MAFDNTVTVVGNITREPELRFTQAGAAVASFGLAHNRKWTDKRTGEAQEDVSFFDVTCWGQLAENVAESLPKGARVIVFGRLDQRTWEAKETGDKRSKVEIQAEDVAPSCKWATVKVVKNERSGSSSSQSESSAPAGGGYDPDAPDAGDF
jgi:single-strand DNA-binding protein